MEVLFNRMQKVGTALIVGGFVLTRFVFVVDGGERALKFDKLRGIQPKIYGEGMHFYIPILQVSIHKLSTHAFRSQEPSRLEPDLN